jgi:preprotein translocase subunit SecF
VSDASSEPVSAPTRRSLPSRLYHGETDFQFVRRWRLWFAVSGAIILIGLLSLFTRGLNLGIDFKGGVVWEVPAGKTSVARVRDDLAGRGLPNANVQTLGSSTGTVLRVQGEASKDLDRQAISARLAELTGARAQEVSFNEVGPSWGKEISSKATRALIIFLILVSLYITFRFELKMAGATLAALIHDLLVTVGVYSVAGFPVTPATVIAILTILGYSIYDGIVVFDRVDENAKALSSSGATTYSEMVNRSLNEVLMRTLNTSITALIPILSLLLIGSFFLGATTLQEFALALFIGLASGAYSSIFIASPLLALLKEREERWANLRRRLDGRAPGLQPSGVASSPSSPPSAPPRPRPPAAVRPRPRKKGRRR